MHSTRPSKKHSSVNHGLDVGALELTADVPHLPTLGLNKYMNWDVRADERNPFRTHKNTEMLLVARERERKQCSLDKRQKRGLHIYEKSIQTRTNRAGVIREINHLKPS